MHTLKGKGKVRVTLELDVIVACDDCFDDSAFFGGEDLAFGEFGKGDVKPRAREVGCSDLDASQWSYRTSGNEAVP